MRQARKAPGEVLTASTWRSYMQVEDKMSTAIATRVLTAMQLCPKRQRKAANAVLLIGDPFVFPQRVLADEIRVFFLQASRYNMQKS